jgi:hypothetical protein
MVMKRWREAMRPSVDDYHALLARAASVLRNDSSEARQRLYDSARAALQVEFSKFNPSDAEFSEERRKLDVAIFDFEFSAPLGVN